MTIEELKAALDAALVALAADKENADLKTKAEEAQSAYDAAVAAESGEILDESKLDEKSKAILAKLRKEAASARTKNKDLASKLTAEQEKRKAILKAAGIEDESEKPEEQVKLLKAQNNQQSFRAAVLESAIEHGISKDGLKYYSFLLSEATAQLNEGEELPDEEVAKIVAEVKKGFGTKQAATSTVVDKDGKPVVKDPSSKEGLTFEKFVSMSILEKSKVYTDNPAQYEEFMKQAKLKKKLV